MDRKKFGVNLDRIIANEKRKKAREKKSTG
jgi:hypothetical protein